MIKHFVLLIHIYPSLRCLEHRKLWKTISTLFVNFCQRTKCRHISDKVPKTLCHQTVIMILN